MFLVLSGLLVGLHCTNEEGRGIGDASQLFQLNTYGALDGASIGGGGEVMQMVILSNIYLYL